MKTFFIYSNWKEPYGVQAESYVREGNVVRFLVQGEIVHTVISSSMLTIAEE